MPERLAPHAEMRCARPRHAIAAFAPMTIILAHIYRGAAGMERAPDAMGAAFPAIAVSAAASNPALRRAGSATRGRTSGEAVRPGPGGAGAPPARPLSSCRMMPAPPLLDSPAPHPLAPDATALRDRLAAGQVTARAAAEACLAAIDAQEETVRAFAWTDAAHVLAQADARDAARAAGAAQGPLHGLPVALKDIIDTAGIPTGNGTALDDGRVPARESWIAARLAAAGAVLIGKTVTTELAYLQPSVTRNPVNPAHTPGGSSAGSAAAVAAGMVPLAVGSQTGGSVIRPAAFCGVTGFKPSFGAIPRSGVLVQSPALDTMGTFAASPRDAALLAEVLFGFDAADPATRPAPVPALHRAAAAPPPRPPVLGLIAPPGWERADPAIRALLADLVAALGPQAVQLQAPAALTGTPQVRACINHVEMAHHFAPYAARDAAGLSDILRAAMAEGQATPAPDYVAARAAQAALDAALAPLFDACDALLLPAAPGVAPEGFASTGDSIFNGPWTLAGTPAITFPARRDPATGLPLAVQLVGRRGEDARLLRTAGWLFARLAGG